jgi:BirA family biotin operon repressor/biotin-[acetyl-CoA-carboxylase] ligase
MDEIDRLAAMGEPEGLVVVAESQTAGRGRTGRTWESAPRDGLLFSALLRPQMSPSEIAVFPLVAGLAVAQAIDEIAGVTTSLKWPNDVLINERKAGGILMTSRVAGETVEFLNIGVGINVVGETLHRGATTLAAESGRLVDREHLFASVLANLDKCYASFCTAGGKQFIHGWNARAAFLGEEVTVVAGSEMLKGICRGADDTGALVLEHDDGSLERVVAGELTRGPRRAGEKIGPMAQ